jgi:hypothetical protein
MKTTIIIILLLLVFPLVSFAQTEPDWPTIYKGGLERMGVKFINEPTDPNAYQYIWEVLDTFNTVTGKKFNLTYEFFDRAFLCGNHIGVNAVGCYWYSKGLTQVLGNFGDKDGYKWVIFHEYGHSLGLILENDANEFADKYTKTNQ